MGGSLSTNDNKVVAIVPAIPDPRVRWEVTLLDLPLTISKHWYSRYTDTVIDANGGLWYHSVEKIKRSVHGYDCVTTPAGHFQCVQIEDSTIVYKSSPYSCRFCDSSVVITNEWYALSIGMVKQTVRATYQTSSGSYTQNIDRTNTLRSYNLQLSN